MKTAAILLIALPGICVAAPPAVYRCEFNGSVSYSDAPCVGAKVIDATPTKGMDKMTGRTSKGKEVQRDEYRSMLDNATRPLHGLSHEEMEIKRRRLKLSAADQIQCASLDSKLPTLERATQATGSDKAQAEVALYQARKRVFELKC